MDRTLDVLVMPERQGGAQPSIESDCWEKKRCFFGGATVKEGFVNTHILRAFIRWIDQKPPGSPDF
jgi:hypothetical protein